MISIRSIIDKIARHEKELPNKKRVTNIETLGSGWSRYPLIEEYCVMEDGKVDLVKTLEKMQSSRVFYKKQINDGFKFKMQTGADYSDFSDRFDDYTRMERQLGEAIAYIEGMIGEPEK